MQGGTHLACRRGRRGARACRVPPGVRYDVPYRAMCDTMESSKLRFGVVGAGAGRGGPDQLLAQMRDELPALGAAVSALCDPDEVALTAAAATVGLEPTEHCFTDYVTMLDSGLVDAVLIATPMEFHAAQTIEALERNIHVLCEVTAAVSVAECRAVVEAASCSAAHYAMAENYMYARYTQFLAKLIEDGRLGEPHYAEGEYLSHGAYSSTVWRRKWMVGRKGITCKSPKLNLPICARRSESMRTADRCKLCPSITCELQTVRIHSLRFWSGMGCMTGSRESAVATLARTILTSSVSPMPVMVQ